MKRTSLRSRIRNGALAMLAIAIVSGAIALPKVYELSGAVAETLHRNYLSIEAARHMREALFTLQLAQRDAKAAGVLSRSRATFMRWIDVEQHDITEPGESELAADIERRGRTLFDEFAADPRANRDLEFTALNARCDKLVAINQAAMFRADSRAIRLGKRVTREFAAGLGLLLLIGVAFAWALAAAITKPLDEMAERLRSFSTRAPHLRFGEQSLAELDAVAQEFNRLAERLEKFDQLNVDQLMYEKAKTEAIIESLEDGIVLLDPDGIVVHINELAALIIGVERAEALGSPFDDLSSNHPHYLKVRAALRAATGEEPVEIELDVRGRKHVYMLRTTALRQAEGRPLGSLLKLADITYLRDRDRARANLIARLSEELKTPLASLSRAAAELRQSNGSIDPKRRALMNTVSEDVARLCRTVDELLKPS